MTANMEAMLYEHEQLCAELEHLLASPQVRDMANVAIEVEQATDSYLEEAQQFLDGVGEYDVDFERLRTFCSCYPSENPLTEEREKLAQAVDDFDYEAIAQMLEEIIRQLKED